MKKAVAIGAIGAIGTIVLSLGGLRLRGARQVKVTAHAKHVEVDTDKRIFVVGDVHGCVDELQKLLFDAKVDHATTQVVLVGDVVNKGPKNVAALRFAKEIQALAVRGNHEESVLRRWNQYKREQTEPPSHMLWVKELSDEDVRWLNALPYTIKFPRQNVIIVHAGLVPRVPLSEQSVETMVGSRNLVTEPDGALRAIDSTGEGVAIGSTWPGPELVCFGHDAKRMLQVHEHAIGLDTGCVYGKRLTGMYLDTREMFVVAAAKVYSPPRG